MNISFDFEQNALKLAILDDGYGMDENELIEAMRPGTKNPLDERTKNDLGRFGLGLKTASFSQCRKLTVVSSKNNKISAAVWDLDYVAETEDWTLQLLNNKEFSEVYKFSELQSNGTLVVWEKTDRIIDNTINTITEEIIYEKIRLVEKHLALIFHRFLKGSNKINIYINRKIVEPFDPFHSAHIATQELQEEIININNEKIIIRPYILPHYSKLSQKEYDYYDEDGGYLKNQGFYVYRNKRLLISGTWFRIIRQSEMFKLARIQIDLPNNLDSLWKIDVRKSYASPPSIIRRRLSKIIEKISGASSKVYTARGHRTTTTNISFWERYAARGEIKYSINKEHPIIQNFLIQLDNKAQEDFNEILDLVGSFLPKDALYADLGNNNPKKVNTTDISDEFLENLAAKKIIIEKDFLTAEEFLSLFQNTEPFNLYKKDWKIFLEKVLA